MTSKTLIVASAALAAGIAMASAQTAPGQDPHHPGDGAGTAQTPPAPPSTPRTEARGPMQPGAMPMQPSGPGMMMGGGDPFRHIEGQIAFYRAELKITDAQTAQWNAFADALRTNAGHLRQAMMKARDAQGAVTAPVQMERRIAMLTEMHDAMQAMLVGARPLYATLSDDQKKVADELMAEHMMTMRARGM